ncbi:MAG TPA: 7TM diverse intracellular signaling domain-containing protein [Polyangiales bacterium]|nr:7TM diverse intracellular signaling domain-containing protein [Polyangiales bacterium]
MALAALSLPNARAESHDGSFKLNATSLQGEPLGLFIDVLEDTSGNLDIESVRAPEQAARFQRSQETVLGFGLTKSAYWLRFVVTNREQERQHWILELSYPSLDDVRLFVPRRGGDFELRQTGDQLPFYSRDIRNRNYLFDLEQPPGVSTYYMRVQTTGSLSLPLHVWSPRGFIEHLSSEHPPLWIFYGLMLVMAAYNLFIYFSVRETAYLHYVCYIVSYIGLQFSLNGFAFEYLWPESVWWNSKALLIWLYFGFGFGLTFQRDFLTLWREFPRLDRVSKAMAFVSFALSAAALGLPYALGIRILVFWGIAVVSFVLFVAVRAAARRSRPALFYGASWLALLAGIMLFLLRTLGVLEDSFLSVWGPQLGASVEVTLLSLGLADRINVMRGHLQGLNVQLTDNVDKLTHALERAEAATRAKGEFVASVSHELRTPLNAIVNIPEGLLEEFHSVPALACRKCEALFALEPGEPADTAQACPQCGSAGTLSARDSWVFAGNPEDAMRHLGSLHKASKHLLGVVSSILDFSKLEAERLELNVTEVDLAKLLEDTVTPLAPLAESKGVQLKLLSSPGDLRVCGDSVRIAQIVVNLVGNAIKFSVGRGDVEVWIEAESDACVIHVRDRGIGISARDQGKLFQSFSQVDSSDTRRFGGTGLGLAISKRLVELHAGRIWFDSEVDKGSTFHVRLPRSGPMREPESTAASTPATSLTHASGAP